MAKETQPDPQRERAIRRAVEGTAHIKRPAEWTAKDYRTFEVTLAANGFELVAKSEEGTK